LFLEMNVKQVVAALFAGGLVVSAAQAAPRAESAMECGVAADMAVVANSLAREQIQRPKADAIMVRIYDVSESDRGRELLRDIIDAAYSQRDNSASAGATASGQDTTASGQKFAEDLFATCMKSGGDMDRILGRRS
jgi:lipopolysaccharide export LptBFGC system permease protein LptF